jgi:hypothetical protein
MTFQVLQQETDEGTRIYDGVGELWVRRCAPGVIHFRYEGVVSGGFFKPGLEEVLRAARGGAGQVAFFVDAYELKDYAPEFREQWVNWFRGNRSIIRRYVMLHRSVLVKLGMTVANVALGGMLEGFSSQEAFDQELAAAGGGTSSRELHL